MITVTESQREAFLNGSTKSITIYFPDIPLTLTESSVVAESLELTQSIETEENLSFIGCVSSKLKFRCGGITQDLTGEKVEVSISAGNTTAIKLFTGYISDQDNLTHEDIITGFTAYDELFKISNTDVSAWYKGLTFDSSLTLASFRNSLCTYLGITQQTATLVNDAMVVTKTIDPDVLAALDVFQAIAQANAVFIRFNGNGVLEYKTLELDGMLYPAEDLYPSDDLYPGGSVQTTEYLDTDYISASHQAYETEPIDKVVIRESDSDIGGIYGSGTNSLIVENNFLFYGKTATELNTYAQNIYGIVSVYDYVPYTLSCVGIPWLEVGDRVSFVTETAVINTFVLNRTLKGIQALVDDYSADGTQYRNEQVASVNTQVKQLQTRTAKIITSVDEISTELTRYETATDGTIDTMQSNISQNATNITAKVSKTGGTSSSFAWSLQDSAFSLTSNNSEVFRADSDGITVNGNGSFSGEITATSGTIGEWTVSGSGSMYHTNGSNTIVIAHDGSIINQVGDDIMYALQYDGNAQFNGNVTISGNATIAGYTKTSDLEANYITASQISANYATFNWVQSNYITASSVSATYATISSLNAVDAKFGSLNASNITSGTLSADRIDVASLAARSFSGYTINAGTINNEGSYIIVGGSAYQAKTIYAYASSSATTKTAYQVLCK